MYSREGFARPEGVKAHICENDDHDNACDGDGDMGCDDGDGDMGCDADTDADGSQVSPPAPSRVFVEAY